MKEIEIRTARKGDLPQLLKLWERVFGDEERYIKLYLEHFFDENQAMVLLFQGSIVSAVYMPALGKLVMPRGSEGLAVEGIRRDEIGGEIPWANASGVERVWMNALGSEGSWTNASGGEGDWINATDDEGDWNGRVPCASIYSFGTLPEYRGKGFGERLLRAALKKSGENGYSAGVICPAEDSLFGYYKGFGYRDFFSVREIEGNRELFLGKGSNSKVLTLVSDCGGISAAAARAEAYQGVRDQFLEGLGCPFISFDLRSLKHQEKISSLYGGGLYLLKGAGETGCCCVEYADQGTLLVKELLFSESGLEAAMEAIAKAFPVKRYVFRMPVLLGQRMGGEVRRFGMLLESQGGLDGTGAGVGTGAGNDDRTGADRCCDSITDERTGYFGFAFD